MTDSRHIHLTQGQVAIVDADNYERLNAHKWCAWWNKSTRSFYAVRSTYAVVEGKRKEIKVYMHRDVLGLEPGDPLQGDHINHSTLDNRQSNLRAATRSQQQANTRRHIDGRSGFKGVCWNKEINKWYAQIQVNGRQRYLGSFNVAEDAARAYDAAALNARGNYALINFYSQSLELPIAA